MDTFAFDIALPDGWLPAGPVVYCGPLDDEYLSAEPADNIGSANDNTVNLLPDLHQVGNAGTRRRVSANVDKLEVTIRGKESPLPDGRIEELNRLYNEGKNGVTCGTSSAVFLPNTYNFLGQPCAIKRSPAGNLIVLCEGYFRVFFNTGKGDTIATITVDSLPFWVRTVREVVNDLHSWVEWFFCSREVKLHVSRLDLCSDYENMTFLYWSNREFRRHLVGHAALGRTPDAAEDEYITPETVTNDKRGVTTGFNVGSRKAPVYARIYDKDAELAQSGKDNYYLPHWQQNGYEGGRVMRVEFELHRAFFRGAVSLDTGELLDDVDSVVENLGAIWHYLTHKWMRIVEPSETDTRKSRAPVHLAWQLVARPFVVVASDVQGVHIRRYHDRRVTALFDQGVGCFASAFAMELHGEVCPDDRYLFARVEEELLRVARYHGYQSVSSFVHNRWRQIEGDVRKAA